MNGIFGNTLSMTQKSLDYLWLKQSVSINNISNNDTPGYKAKFVSFENHLKNSLLAARRTGEGNRQSLAEGIQRADSSIRLTTDAARMDGNNVQMEAENTELVRSYLQYQYQVQSLNSDINRLRIAIKG